jgi:hypothetical protein
MRQMDDGLMTAIAAGLRHPWRGRNKNFAHRDASPLD